MKAYPTAALPMASVELLASAVAEIEQAVGRPRAGDRYVSGHLGARRAAAAVLAARARPTRSGAPRDVWSVLPTVAPELAEWARFFAAGTGRRVAVEAGLAHVVTVREADDLVRDAHNFLTVVTTLLVGREIRGRARSVG